MGFCGHVKSAFPKDEPETQLGSRPGSAGGKGHTSLEQESQPESLGRAALHKTHRSDPHTSCFEEDSVPARSREWEQDRDQGRALEGASREPGG